MKHERIPRTMQQVTGLDHPTPTAISCAISDAIIEHNDHRDGADDASARFPPCAVRIIREAIIEACRAHREDPV